MKFSRVGPNLVSSNMSTCGSQAERTLNCILSRSVRVK